jgi:broad specificity phosphatase PhoE
MIRIIVPRSKTLRETRVLLLRHAETAAPDRFHGAESDIGLSELGGKQAEAVARILADERPNALFSSGMRRARETAAAIGAACGLSAQAVPEFHERRMGPLSGQLKDAAWADYLEAKSRWTAGELDYTHEGGESYRQIRERIVPAFQALASQHLSQTVVLVAHGVVIRVLISSLVEGFGPSDFGRIGIDNVAVNDLRSDGLRWRLVAFRGEDRAVVDRAI